MNEPTDWCKVATAYLPENSSCRVFRILEDTNQIANLKLVYPYIHDSINGILLRFSQGAQHPYEDAETLAADIARMSDLLS